MKRRNAFRKSINQRFRKRRSLEKFYIRSRLTLLSMIRRTRSRLVIVLTLGALNSIVNVSKTTDIAVDTVGAVAAITLKIMKK